MTLMTTIIQYYFLKILCRFILKKYFLVKNKKKMNFKYIIKLEELIFSNF